MVIHALAFLIYIFVFFFVSVVSRLIDPTGIALYYFHWFICTIFGLLSYMCLAAVLWSLGTYKSVESTFPDDSDSDFSSKL